MHRHVYFKPHQCVRCDILAFGGVHEQRFHTHQFHLILPHSPPHPSFPLLHTSLAPSLPLVQSNAGLAVIGIYVSQAVVGQ